MSLWWLIPLGFSVAGLIDLLTRFKAAWDEADNRPDEMPRLMDDPNMVPYGVCRWSHYADYRICLTHGVRESTEVDLEADYLLDTTD